MKGPPTLGAPAITVRLPGIWKRDRMVSPEAQSPLEGGPSRPPSLEVNSSNVRFVG